MTNVPPSTNRRHQPNPLFWATLLAGASIGATAAFVATAIFWPSLSDLAQVAITSSSTVTGAAIAVIGLWARRRI
jgi:hypothetical protein